MGLLSTVHVAGLSNFIYDSFTKYLSRLYGYRGLISSRDLEPR